MFYRQGLSSALLALLATASVQATVLTYDFSGSPGVADDEPVPADYGDRVTGASMSGGGGTYGYSNFGEGFTPNVVADHGDAAFYSAPDASQPNFAYAPNNTFSLTLTADPAFNVTLWSFDLLGADTNYTVDSVSVFANGVRVFFEEDVEVLGPGVGLGKTPFDFSTPIRGNSIIVSFDTTSAGASTNNIGIDDIQFAQTVPEPSVTALGLTAAALAFFFRRFRRSSKSTV